MKKMKKLKFELDKRDEKAIDTFAERLDKIFEDGNPTKALIIDAFHKANKQGEKLDTFAAKVMQGIITSPEKYDFALSEIDRTTEFCYKVAKAMLAEREKHL